MQLAFGAGALWGERTDVVGSGTQQFGIMQDIGIDFDYSLKELFGQKQFSVDQARGQAKITGKAKFARVFGALYGDLFFGTPATTGQLQAQQNEAAIVPAVTPWQVTVANGANFVDDLGVYYASQNGGRFARVVTATVAGTYSVNETTGIYTFVTGDASKAVVISYVWNNSAVGKQIAITNQDMGSVPIFKGTFNSRKVTQGIVGNVTLILNACTASKLSIATRLDDYTIPEMDFSAMADVNDNIGTLSLLE